jgi:hypothetical protein
MKQLKPMSNFEDKELEDLKKLDGSLVKLLNYILLQVRTKEKTTKYYKVTSSKKALYINDRHIDIFHALGMILYNKRVDPTRPDISPQKLSKKEYLTLPTPKPYFNVEKILDSLNMPYQTLNNFLFENYVDHFTNIKELSKMADCFSVADYTTTYQWRNKMSFDYNGLRREETLLNARGCMSYNLSQYEITKKRYLLTNIAR